MMDMCVRAIKKVTADIDTKKAFKTLFVTNALDGSEDYLVKDSIMQLVGTEMLKFREDLMKQKAPKSLKDMLKTITPPKGIKRKNIEGIELLDCEGEEMELPKEDESDEGEEILVIISISL